MEEDRGAARRTDHPHRRLRQLLADGRHRSVRPLLGNLLRPRRQDPGGPPGSADAEGDRFIEIWNLVFMQFEQLPGGARRPAAAVDRHRHGARADRRGAAGHPRQLCHRPVPRADRRHRRTDQGLARRRAEGLAPRHRRSSARLRLPDRRWRAAVERRPRLCAPPHHAARHAPRRAAGRCPRAADVEARAGAGARDGSGLPGAHSAPRR